MKRAAAVALTVILLFAVVLPLCVLGAHVVAQHVAEDAFLMRFLEACARDDFIKINGETYVCALVKLPS